jgi:hypothetical protein
VIVADDIARQSFAFRNEADIATALIFDSLLQWKNTCAVCGEAILPSEKTEKDRMPVSVAVKDQRIGNPHIRSMVSQNRKDVYRCFAEVTMPRQGAYYWHDTHGLLSHYFAKLYHRGCRWFRDKETALA